MQICRRKLEIAMARKCMTESDLCKQSGVPRSTISQIKRGLRNPRPATIGNIAVALCIDVTELMRNEENAEGELACQ